VQLPVEVSILRRAQPWALRTLHPNNVTDANAYQTLCRTMRLLQLVLCVSAMYDPEDPHLH
jgi:hypothetical protein